MRRPFTAPSDQMKRTAEASASQTDAQNRQQIEDIGAGDVAQGNFICAADCSRGADRKLRSAGAQGNNCESDDDAGHLEGARQRSAAVHKKVSALYQSRKTDKQQKNIEEN